MRPLKLTMQAFGAYAKSETIDFTELGQERIFVISGKTGAGKSTIFDAISFAIFGRANTNEREGFSLRSHYASAEDLTEVSLEFLLRDVRYLVRRIPQQDVPKKRGEGMTTVTAKAELYELDGSEERLLASSVRDVGAKMEEVIQLNVDQFRQILMIPQGEFRELLVAESREKEAILQRLAHTHFYQLIENQLWNQQKEQEQQVRLLRAKVAGITQEAFDEEALAGKTAHDIELMFGERLNLEQEMMNGLQEQVEFAKQKAEITAKNVTLAEEKIAEWEQLTKLRVEKIELDKLAEKCDQDQQAINLARKAGAIMDQDALCLQLKQQLDELRLEEKQVLGALENKEEALENAVLEIEKLKEMEQEYMAWIKKQELLQSMEVKVTRALALQQELTQKSEDHQRLTHILERLIKKEHTLLEQSEKLTDRSRFVQESKLRQVEAKQLMMEISQKEAQIATEIKKWEQKQAWQTELVILERHFSIAERQFKEAEARYVALDEKWQQEQVASLALKLVEGDACPVCGSLEHPHLAIETSGVVKAEVEATRKDQLEKNDVAKEIATKIEQKKWQIEQIEYVSEEPFQALKEQQDVCAKELAKIEQEQARLEAFLTEENKLEEQVALNKQETSEVVAQKIKTQQAYEKVRQAVDTTQTTYSLLLEGVPEEFRNLAVFYEQQKNLTEQISAFELRKESVESVYNESKEGHLKAVSAREAAEKAVLKADSALAAQRTIFKDIMVANGFVDYVSYQRAILSEEILAEKERFVRDYEQQYHFVSERLKEMEGKLNESEQPDLIALRQLDVEAKRSYHEKAEQYMRQKETVRKLSDLSEQFMKYLNETSEAEKGYADIGYLADMARGKNNRRLTFERFVLATFLDTILLRANGRLKKMTNGRFQLNRKKEKSKGNVQSGLELEVYDEYTGLERHVKTLSGGESFKTSLALALALAEVVQEMSGGISLETMFIDEGFGTLDPESLEVAVECLLETQESGRLVGIISHVPELKERISSRLEVTATNHGSTTKFFVQGL
ncbi:AAA family ATPase [Paenilisteria rocourtiae]|uniref:Nuclease SbcCD subunit C n=1 Tax=Listeria rocourtiae TaxID=647910 RepID=A0A4R6ZNS5_9LIST|nr:SMC family ATPase [Listeria rocourtiae]MBC1603654.1 SMC family ATPase [Listeria rocourtiae]TDR54012.1 exonuclease SbcC [Listeria rocourtiae]